jgi:hypothetical protein
LAASLFPKERLLNFGVNMPQPILGTKGAVTKMSNLDLQFSCSLLSIPRLFFGCPYLEC